MLLPPFSVNQSAPSGPAAMKAGWPPLVGIGYSALELLNLRLDTATLEKEFAAGRALAMDAACALALDTPA
jgi:hypothetical protein